MFILSNSSFGDGIFQDCPPSSESYQKVSFYGNCVLDGIHALNYTMSDPDLVAISSTPIFSRTSILCANFEDTLEAGSLITTINLPINKYIIRRKVKGGSLNPVLMQLDYQQNLNTFEDYTPKNNVEYTYTVSPLFDDGVTRVEGLGLEGDGVVSFWGYILSDTAATPTTSYLFDIKIQSDSFKINRGFRIFENHTKYPSFRYNLRQYRSGGLTTIPLNENFEATDAQLQELMAFIENGEEKLLRTPSGDAMKVITSNFSYKYFDEVAEQPYQISFEIVEIDSV